MLRICEASPDDRETWDGVVKASRTGTIFHTEDWLEILEGSLGLQVTRLAAIEKGEIVAAMPVTLNKRPKEWLITKRLPFTAVSPPILRDNPYGGPCTLPNRRDAESALLRYVLQKYPAGEIHFSPDLSPDTDSNSQLTKTFYKNRIAYFRSTSVMDLTLGEDTLWSRCSHEMRNCVGKAKRFGVKIVSSNDPQDMKYFYWLLHQTYARSGFSPFPSAFYYQAFNILKNKDRAKLFFAKVDGKRAASQICLMFKDRTYAWTACSDRAFSSYRPSNLLFWEIAEWAKGAGLSHYDLCGMDIPNIARFKKGFGGRLYVYPCVKWKSRSYSAVSRILEDMRKVRPSNLVH